MKFISSSSATLNSCTISNGRAGGVRKHALEAGHVQGVASFLMRDGPR